MVQTGVGPDGKPIMTLMQDPSIAPDLKLYPMWITTGKDPNTGDPIGKAVDSLEKHIALCQKLGMPVPGETKAEVPRPAPAVSAVVPMTRGQKIAATKARKKAERVAQAVA